MKKIGVYTHYLNGAILKKNAEKFHQDGYYKAIRIFCRFLLDRELMSEDEVNKIKRYSSKPQSNADIYTPTNSDMIQNMELLKTRNKRMYMFCQALQYSGVRITELLYYINNKDKFKIIQKDGFYKVLLNYKRHTKNSYYIYLPSGIDLPSRLSQKYINKFFQQNKDLIRLKYFRNWFYYNALESGLTPAVIDFIQGRVPISIGSKHYLDKERMADKLYLEVVEGKI